MRSFTSYISRNTIVCPLKCLLSPVVSKQLPNVSYGINVLNLLRYNRMELTTHSLMWDAIALVSNSRLFSLNVSLERRCELFD